MYVECAILAKKEAEAIITNAYALPPLKRMFSVHPESLRRKSTDCQSELSMLLAEFVNRQRHAHASTRA